MDWWGTLAYLNVSSSLPLFSFFSQISLASITFRHIIIRIHPPYPGCIQEYGLTAI
jgi:hypothetical protein